MRALRLESWKSEPVLTEVDTPEPGPGEVLVQVGAAGACHSDLHLMHDFEPGVLPWSPPFTLGHENAGWVHALGQGVRGLEPGQPVAVVGAWGCGRCARCLAGLDTSDSTLTTAAAVTRQLGDLTIVGIVGGSLPVSFFGLAHEASVQTTYWGNRSELVEMLDLTARGLLTPDITTFPLDEAPEVYAGLAAGDITGRAVVVPSAEYTP